MTAPSSYTKKKDGTPTLSQAELDELIVKHGEIWRLEGKAVSCKVKELADGVEKVVDEMRVPWEIVIRKPERKDYKLFRSNAQRPERKDMAQEILLRSCLVSPPISSFDKLLDAYPGIPEAPSVSEALAEATGMASEDSEK